jgi:hypothetical protein
MGNELQRSGSYHIWYQSADQCFGGFYMRLRTCVGVVGGLAQAWKQSKWRRGSRPTLRKRRDCSTRASRGPSSSALCSLYAWLRPAARPASSAPRPSISRATRRASWNPSTVSWHGKQCRGQQASSCHHRSGAGQSRGHQPSPCWRHRSVASLQRLAGLLVGALEGPCKCYLVFDIKC